MKIPFVKVIGVLCSIAAMTSSYASAVATQSPTPLPAPAPGPTALTAEQTTQFAGMCQAVGTFMDGLSAGLQEEAVSGTGASAEIGRQVQKTVSDGSCVMEPIEDQVREPFVGVRVGYSLSGQGCVVSGGSAQVAGDPDQALGTYRRINMNYVFESKSQAVTDLAGVSKVSQDLTQTVDGVADPLTIRLQGTGEYVGSWGTASRVTSIEGLSDAQSGSFRITKYQNTYAIGGFSALVEIAQSGADFTCAINGQFISPTDAVAACCMM